MSRLRCLIVVSVADIRENVDVYNEEQANAMWHMKRALLFENWDNFDESERKSLISEMVAAKYGDFTEQDMYRTFELLEETEIYKYVQMKETAGELN